MRKFNISAQGKLAFFFLIPTILFMGLIVVYPLLTTIYDSFFNASLVRPGQSGEFIGLSNYLHLLKDKGFWATLNRTVLWTAGSVIGKTILGLTLALLLKPSFRGRSIYRFLILIPWATPQVIGAVIWKWFFNGQYGMFNFILISLGLASERISVLGNINSAFLAAMGVDIWFGVPFMTMVLLAGLQGIPDEIYDAAAVDGATGLRQFWLITLPLLLPIFTVATNLSVIWTFNSFNVIQTMTGGGPVKATEILVIKTYKEAFGSYNIGMSATYSTIILAILLLFSIIYWRLLQREGEVS